MKELQKQAQLDELTSEIRKYLGNSVKDRLRVGYLLEPISSQSLWKSGDYKSFEDYTYKNFALSKSSAYNYIQISKVFGEYILSNELEVASHKRLLRLLPFVSEENKEELVHEAVELSETDFENQIRERKGTQPTDTCTHLMEDYATLQKCQNCPFITKIKL